MITKLNQKRVTRKIRFRGICDSKCSRKGEMVYGMFRTCNYGEAEGGYKTDYLIDCDEPGEKNHACYTIVPETLGQYTGVEDSKGQEIYEGDIYHQGDPKILYVVEWWDSAFRGRQIHTSGGYAGLEFWSDRIIVLGNIHDNPELLK